jgi:hypothetical protein
MMLLEPGKVLTQNVIDSFALYHSQECIFPIVIVIIISLLSMQITFVFLSFF